jgi:hypothetical protein
LLKQIQEWFAAVVVVTAVAAVSTAAAAAFVAAQLHAVPRPFTLPCGPAVFHPSARRRCDHTAVDRIQVNAIRRLECVRHHRLRTGGLTLIRIEVRSRVRARIQWQASRKAIVSRHSRIAEIQLSQAGGTSETPECSSGMEIISEMQTISGMETISGTQPTSGTQTIFVTGTIIFVVTGKNTSSRGSQGIGIATGTITATTGGMATDARSLTDRG